jgi:hypothetical protein
MTANARAFPVNYHVKNMMKRTLESREIYFYADFHGHSVAKNVFIFGNNQSQKENKNKEKVFPLMFAQNCDYFSLQDCNFGI